MRVLIAEDDAFFRKMLQQLLTPHYEVCAVEDGIRAWDELQGEKPVRLAILDWVMPGLSGPQICRQARSNPATAATYLILLTAKNSIPDIVAGLRSGADDYLTKPFDAEELRARVRVGERVIALQSALEDQRRVLDDSLKRESVLQKLLPICPGCGCKRISSEYWREVEAYIEKAGLEEGICPQCITRQGTGSHSQAATGVHT